LPNDTLPPSPSSDDPLTSQPLRHIELWGTELVILGTAHVSRTSVAAVEHLLANENFDAVAVELCESRAASMRDPDMIHQMDLFQVIRQGKVGMVAASLALAAFQRRLAERLGIEPGAEMRAAMDGAEAQLLPCWMVDREVGTTLRRAWRGVRFRERLTILGNLAGSLFSHDDPEEDDIEALKGGDMLESAFAEFAQDAGSLYTALINERDAYMAARLQQQIEMNPEIRRVLVVIGAGHLSGLVEQLQKADRDPLSKLQKLDRIPPVPAWPKWLAFGTVVAVFALIGYAFYQSPQLGISALRVWIVLTGGLAAVGALAWHIRADTFNAEGLSIGTIERYGIGMAMVDANTLITAYHTKYDPLTAAQNLDPNIIVPGRPVTLPGVHFHGIKGVCEALNTYCD